MEASDRTGGGTRRPRLSDITPGSLLTTERSGAVIALGALGLLVAIRLRFKGALGD